MSRKLVINQIRVQSFINILKLYKLNDVLFLAKLYTRFISKKTYVPPSLETAKQNVNDCLSTVYQIAHQENNNFGALFLYQFKRCPYSGKIKALLDFLKLKYTLLEVDPRSKGLLDWSSYKMVPVLRINSSTIKETFYESNVIVDFLLNQSLSRGVISKHVYEILSDEKQRDVIDWVDRKVAPSLMYLMCRSKSSTKQAYSYLYQLDKSDDAIFANAFSYLRTYNYISKVYNLNAKHSSLAKIKDLPTYFESNLKKWAKFLVDKNSVFHGGDVPNMCDLSLYGVLETFSDIDFIKSSYGTDSIRPWYERMQKVIPKNYIKSYSYLGE